jgi:hypothetical protein
MLFSMRKTDSPHLAQLRSLGVACVSQALTKKALFSGQAHSLPQLGPHRELLQGILPVAGAAVCCSVLSPPG